MDAALIERLLYEEESATLDFKRDQYRFVKAGDDEKSELLKDILGFANAWRRTDAYVLIGVENFRGGRSPVVGISTTGHLADHSLQQFVNALTNRPVRFHYEACEFEAKQIGIFKIDVQQRPLYLKKDYGKLKKNEVYVRRGSGTDPTTPASIDEIAMMGSGGDVVLADLNGLSAELEWNRKLAAAMETAFQEYIDTYGLGTNVSKPSPVPPKRFRLQAVGAYLQRPVMPHDIPIKEVERYWEHGSFCNGMMDKVVGLSTVAVVDSVVEAVMKSAPEMHRIAESLSARITKVLGSR